MPQIDLIMISDDEEPDPQQTLSRGQPSAFCCLRKCDSLTIIFVDLTSLDEEINKVNTTVKQLDNEVSSFIALLRTAQNRLHKAQERREQLIDKKQQLLDKKLKFLESNPAIDVKREVAIKPNIIEVSPTINAFPAALSSYPTYAAPVLAPTALSPGLFTLSI